MLVALKVGVERLFASIAVLYTSVTSKVLIFKQRKYLTVFLLLWTQILSCKFFIICNTHGN